MDKWVHTRIEQLAEEKLKANEPPQFWGFMQPYDGEITKEDMLAVIHNFKRMIWKSDRWNWQLDEEFGDGHAWMCLDKLEEMLQ